MVRIVLMAASLLVGTVHAEGYDYIRGDDVYEEDYDYGVDYDGLSSVPQTRLRGSRRDDAGGRLKQQARDLQKETTQPSMTRELEKWKADDSLTPPALGKE
ncbi:MAG: hypothetical protein ACFE0K_07500 [Alcanivorax sp.]|uniref:hypothetical protein n=1 Tax=Alcanivorax sp. TaxID=1872427 RepID=UPI003DA7519F